MHTALYSEILNNLEAESRLRSIPSQNSDVVDLLSNDYLGLAIASSDFRDEFLSGLSHFRMSSSASRLLSREQDDFMKLEKFLSELYGNDALCFNSGYHANTGLVSALNIGNTLFICDRLVHASIFDGLQLGKCKFTRFKHNDMNALRMLLSANTHLYENIVVIVESIYSMDGDEAPLKELAEMRNEFSNMMLYVDEAHAVGVRGYHGLGVGEETGILNNIDILVGTFGKALASAGAYVICDKILKDFFINTSRSFIFSTAISPVQAAWSKLMLEKCVNMHGERAHLEKISKKLRKEVSKYLGYEIISTSQIIPIITGSADKAISLASMMRNDGFDVLPIRRPTVPPKGERIRISLSAVHSEQIIDKLLESLKKNLQKL